MDNRSKGDLVYIPSDTILIDSASHSGAKQVYLVKAPQVFLVLEKKHGMYKLMHKGKNWYVEEKKVYSVKE
tara:strand:- start:3666 stop:3878 length:213 start_codon:yes stop_codon:yes gene_type:complete